jgi:hypothetical protein
MNMSNEFNRDVGEQAHPQQEFKWRHFLGRNDPERIVRDRDRVMSN